MGKAKGFKVPSGAAKTKIPDIDINAKTFKVDVNVNKVDAGKLSSFKKAQPNTKIKAQKNLSDALGVPTKNGKLDLSGSIGNRIEIDGKMTEIDTKSLKNDAVNLDDLDPKQLNDLDASAGKMIKNIKDIEVNLKNLEMTKIGPDGKMTPQLKAEIEAVKLDLDMKRADMMNFKQKINQKMNAPGKPDTIDSFSYKGVDGKIKNVEIEGGVMKVNGKKIDTPELQALEADNMAKSLEVPKTKTDVEAKADFKRKLAETKKLKKAGLDFEMDADGNITIKNKNLDPNAKRMQGKIDEMKRTNKFSYKKLAALAALGFGVWTLANYIDCEVKKSKGDTWYPTTVDKITCNDIMDVTQENYEKIPEDAAVPPKRFDFIGSTIRGKSMIKYSMTNEEGYKDWELDNIISPAFVEENEKDGKLPYELEESSNNTCVLRWKTEMEKTEDCSLDNAIAQTWSQIGSAGKELTKGAIKAVGETAEGAAEGGLEAVGGLLDSVFGGALDSMGLGWVKDNLQTIGLVISGIVLLIVAFKVYKMFKGGGGGGE